MTFNLKKYKQELSVLVSNNAVSENHQGLSRNFDYIRNRLKQAQFEIQIISPNSSAPIIYAIKGNPESSKKVGLYSHYDVELTNEEKWTHNATKLHVIEDRLYGRGVADNLGILLLRMMAIENLPDAEIPEIHWIFQGEEEIGAPLAHEEFPKMNIPKMNVWFEETGYYDLGRYRQRYLTLNEDPDLTNVLEIATDLLNDLQFSAYTENRILTKFDECPFIKHILLDQPYLAIGPNDEYSRIHEPNESLSIPLIQKSFEQFSAVLKHYSKFKIQEDLLK
ncbi:M20/M25/M40 family metallo-hydrolase [Crocinitomicaceae bacterium]|nr:M20/M25/M40 family metallo-hydrolase [Crocinitomicaceae bacterium]MDC0459622.1 M20/M25/M40 family metallo-hydrolase [Crocinitomicaceae bacterium]